MTTEEKKENLFKYTKELLGSYGFVLESTTYEDGTLEEQYVLHRTIQRPGARISINGRIMQQPGTEYVQDYIIEVNEGAIDFEPVILLKFSVKRGDHTVLEEGLWFDYEDREDINRTLTNLLNN